MLDKKRFSDWVESEATQFFMSYLLDFRSSILESAKQRIEVGAIMSEVDQAVIAAQVEMLSDMASPDDDLYDDIQSFYEEPEELEDEDNPSMGKSSD